MILNDSFLQIKNAPFLKDLEIAESEGFKECFFDSILKLKNIERLAFFDVQYFLVVPIIDAFMNKRTTKYIEQKTDVLKTVRYGNANFRDKVNNQFGSPSPVDNYDKNKRIKK